MRRILNRVAAVWNYFLEPPMVFMTMIAGLLLFIALVDLVAVLMSSDVRP